MDITCDFCNKPLTELGGLLFSPPDGYGHCKKRHICKPCYSGLSQDPKPEKEPNIPEKSPRLLNKIPAKKECCKCGQEWTNHDPDKCNPTPPEVELPEELETTGCGLHMEKINQILKFGWPRLLFIIAAGALCFYWITGGTVNTDIQNLWYKLNDFIDKNMAFGGWHRALAIIGVTLPVWLPVLIIMRRKKNEL